MTYKLINLQNDKSITNPTDADIQAAVNSIRDDFWPVLALETFDKPMLLAHNKAA